MSNQLLATASDPVSGDVPCRRCQYNLRGLGCDGLCPECGTPVRLSVRGDLLQFADPQWVGLLQTGTFMALWAMVLEYGLYVARVPRSAWRISLGAYVLSEGAALLVVLGMWWQTTPDPSGLGEPAYGSWRKFARLTLFVAVASQLFQVTLRFSGLALSPGRQLGLFAEQRVVSFVACLGTFATLTYLGRLCDCLPDEPLARRAGRLRWWLISAGLIMQGILGASQWTQLLHRRPSWVMRSALAMWGWFSVFFFLLFVVIDLFFLARLNEALREAATAAKRSWAQGRATPGETVAQTE